MDGSGSKMAATVLAAVMETVQVAPLAESHPLQVESTDPASGVAVNCTVDPSLALAVQVAPHSTPLPSTEPPPPPTRSSSIREGYMGGRLPGQGYRAAATVTST